MAIDIVQTNLDGTGLRIGIVRSRFNAYAGDGLLESALATLKDLGVSEEDITLVNVPGALEIPLALQQLAQTNDYDALIALGAVIRGETYHFDLVANESAAGISRIALDFDIPVANAVLTTENDEQCQERLEKKGEDAARVAVEMANMQSEISEREYVEDIDSDEDGEER